MIFLFSVSPIINSILKRFILQRSPIDEVVEDVVRRLVNAICCDIPSTSKYSASTPSKDPDPVIESLHYEMISKAAKLMEKVGNIKYFMSCLYVCFFASISKFSVLVYL